MLGRRDDAESGCLLAEAGRATWSTMAAFRALVVDAGADAQLHKEQDPEEVVGRATLVQLAHKQVPGACKTAQSARDQPCTGSHT